VDAEVLLLCLTKAWSCVSHAKAIDSCCVAFVDMFQLCSLHNWIITLDYTITSVKIRPVKSEIPRTLSAVVHRWCTYWYVLNVLVFSVWPMGKWWYIYVTHMLVQSFNLNLGYPFASFLDGDWCRHICAIIV